MALIDHEPLKQVAAEYGDAQLVVLFGSVPRGNALPWSDADIGVLGMPFWRGLELGSRLGQLLHREPHVVELEHATTWLRYLVAREGVLLHESQPGAWARFQAEAALQWFDMQPIVALCSDGARRALLGDRRG